MIVFASGCFDLLHAGHADFLSRARSLGDLLIVGLDTDESVRLCKGAGHPICTYEERLAVLEACRDVFSVHPFCGADGLHELLRRIKPNIVAKGSDYTAEAAEAAVVQEWGGQFIILPSRSLRTSDIIERIKSQ